MHLSSILVFVSAAVLGSEVIQPRQSCSGKYEVCSPAGVSNFRLPQVGPRLSNLYADLVQAINSESVSDLQRIGSDEVINIQAAVPFCCAQTTECLVLPSYHIQFCWDRFTTNFYFPDGSYGSIVAGNYSSASGTKVDLIYGNWESQDGTRGNIYSNTPSMMPDTSTLPMPSPWTSSGVGSAIPASELGSSPTLTSATRTTISAITLPSSTISVGTSICTHCSLTIVPGLTGLPPATTVLTNGSTFPITTMPSSGTGTPSSSTSMNVSSSIIIPPFTSNFDKAFAVPSMMAACIVFNLIFCAFIV